MNDSSSDVSRSELAKYYSLIYSKKSSVFYEFEISLSCSKKPAAARYPEPDQCDPKRQTALIYDPLDISFLPETLSPKLSLPSDFTAKSSRHFAYLPRHFHPPSVDHLHRYMVCNSNYEVYYSRIFPIFLTFFPFLGSHNSPKHAFMYPLSIHVLSLLEETNFTAL